ncbi:hypothetical protein FACS189415_2540 [Bacteroidia bacterium]|nr:hypothetical protein FACS189426_04730 [Bacteroidia bacterium]GHT29079.1 hypothetical protein FACS189432_07900 [Bacteroidia bacterium]GHU82313.1 hypothetical protein FACS189415_2540 [Bacteroidia bacterium]
MLRWNKKSDIRKDNKVFQYQLTDEGGKFGKFFYLCMQVITPKKKYYEDQMFSSYQFIYLFAERKRTKCYSNYNR